MYEGWQVKQDIHAQFLSAKIEQNRITPPIMIHHITDSMYSSDGSVMNQGIQYPWVLEPNELIAI